MTRTSIASRFVAPATVALAALMLVASPVGLGKSGLVLQQAKASTSLDTNSPDNSSNSADNASGSKDSSSKDSNGGSGAGGNAGTNGGSHDAGNGGGSHDGAGDH